MRKLVLFISAFVMFTAHGALISAQYLSADLENFDELSAKTNVFNNAADKCGGDVELIGNFNMSKVNGEVLISAHFECKLNTFEKAVLPPEERRRSGGGRTCTTTTVCRSTSPGSGRRCEDPRFCR